MGRSPILAIAVTALLVSSLGFPDPAHAQVPRSVLASSVRPSDPGNRCDNAPPACQGAGWISTEGLREFDVYKSPETDDPTDGVRFCMTWPEGWSFISAEICYGTLVSGDPSVRGALLEFAFADCPYAYGPFLRVVLDCPTPGSFSLGCSPTFRICGSGGSWMEELIPSRCDVGDWCGRLPSRPCDWCSMMYRHAAGFDPPNLQLTVQPGQAWIGLMYANGDLGPSCGGAPECGEPYGACLAGLESDVPWMTLTAYWPPEEGYQSIPYMLRVDASGLAPGRYDGNIVSDAGCSWCVSNCMPVTLIVLGPAAADESSPARATRLDGPYPNPAAERFDYTVTLGAPTRARVTILDVAGRRVAELLDRDLPAGIHTLSYSRQDGGLASGSYILRLEAGAVRQSRLIVLTR